VKPLGVDDLSHSLTFSRLPTGVVGVFTSVQPGKLFTASLSNISTSNAGYRRSKGVADRCAQKESKAKFEASRLHNAPPASAFLEACHVPAWLTMRAKKFSRNNSVQNGQIALGWRLVQHSSCSRRRGRRNGQENTDHSIRARSSPCNQVSHRPPVGSLLGIHFDNP
jgi:hypothetical protein